MEDLRRKGVVEEILQKLRFESPIFVEHHHKKPAIHKKIDEGILQLDVHDKGIYCDIIFNFSPS